MGRTTAIWRWPPMGHMRAAPQWNFRQPVIFTFTLSLWTQRARSKETSRRSSIENMRKVLNSGGDQDHWVKCTGTFASACGAMTRRTSVVDTEAALDSITNFTMAGPHSEGLP